jgi:uncharacterized membrane protein
MEFVNGDVVEQIVEFNNTNLECISFAVSDRTVSCSGNIKVELIDEENECVWSDMVNIDNITLKNRTWFRPDITVTTQTPYRFVITADNLKGKVYISVLGKDDNIDEVDENLYVNGVQQDSSLMVGVTYPKHIDNLTKAIIIAVCILASILIIWFEDLFSTRKKTIYTLGTIGFIFVPLLWLKRFNGTLDNQSVRLYVCIMAVYFAALLINVMLFYIKKCRKVEIYFIVTYLFIGILYMAILPPFSAPDEGTHFSMSYRISNKIMGEPIDDGNGSLYMRACDSYDYINIPGREYTIDTFEEVFDPLEETEEMVSSGNTRFTATYTVLYIPQAIGLTVGRLLHCNSVMLLYIGRLFNMLAFGVIVFLAIRLIPRGKWVLYAISQIPIVMEQVTSFSYDTLIIGFTILYVSCIIYLIDRNKKASLGQLVGLLLLGVFIAPMKYVYIFIVGLVLLINDTVISDNKWKAIVYKAVCIIVPIIYVIMVVTSSTVLYTSAFKETYNIENSVVVTEVPGEDYETLIYGEDRIIVDDDDYYTTKDIQFIINNPIDFIEDSIETVFDAGETYCLQMFGNSLGSNEIKMPFFLTLFTIILFLVAAYGVHENGKIELGIYKKLIVVLIGIAIAGSILLVFYRETPPSRRSLWGVQGRYFVPILPLILFDSNIYGTERDSRKELLIFGSLGIHLLVVLNVILVIWMR